MGVADRRARERSARRGLITATARGLAEREGWSAVTTRRLAREIEYSQPVIYQHFGSLDGLVEAVALEGFSDLADRLRRARTGGGTVDGLGAAAGAYLDFAAEQPALYDAMFVRATGLRFAAGEIPAPMFAAYSELRDAVAPVSAGRDVDTVTEVVWAGLHGLVSLERGGRLRPEARDARLALVVSLVEQDVAGHE